jgi:threonine/homoserine/homoserine lactone efflux protein
MTTFAKYHSDRFFRAFAAIAIIGPILLVIAAGALPQGLVRGAAIVHGHEVVVAALVIAAVLRTAYAVGFDKALQIAASARHAAMPA